MPDLDNKAVEAWIRVHEPGASNALPHATEVDDMPSVLVELVRLGEALDRARAHDPEGLCARLGEPGAAAGMQTLLGHLHPARRLRLMHWLGAGGTPGARDLLGRLWADTADGREPDAGALVRRSLQRLHRSACMARIFAPGRVSALAALCAGGV